MAKVKQIVKQNVKQSKASLVRFELTTHCLEGSCCI